MRELLGRLYDGFGSGDASVWTDNVADDVIGIGTDADESWEDRSLIAKVAAGPGDEQCRRAADTRSAPHRYARRRRLASRSTDRCLSLRRECLDQLLITGFRACCVTQAPVG